jgi:hypothetical protein
MPAAFRRKIESSDGDEPAYVPVTWPSSQKQLGVSVSIAGSSPE